MLDLEQCPFCNGKLEIATLNCPSGGTPCYCFRCTKCGGIRRFGTLNPADLCWECDIALRVIALEELAKRLLDTIAKMQEENRDMQRDIKTLRSMTWC